MIRTCFCNFYPKPKRDDVEEIEANSAEEAANSFVQNFFDDDPMSGDIFKVEVRDEAKAVIVTLSTQVTLECDSEEEIS